MSFRLRQQKGPARRNSERTFDSHLSQRAVYRLCTNLLNHLAHRQAIDCIAGRVHLHRRGRVGGHHWLDPSAPCRTCGKTGGWKDGGWSSGQWGWSTGVVPHCAPAAAAAAAAAAAERKGPAVRVNLGPGVNKADFDASYIHSTTQTGPRLPVHLYPRRGFPQQYPRGHGAAGAVRGGVRDVSAREGPQGARSRPGRAMGFCCPVTRLERCPSLALAQSG